MATADVASLQIRIESLEAEVAERRLDKLAKTGGKAEKATDGLTASFARLVTPILATVSALGALNKLVEVQRQFDKLNAGLITATGSSEKAAQAFEALQDFAQKTPYDLNQAVEGFTKLVNLGLTPSEKALTSYGNTASAMGKDLNQMIEAVADAATGEFERLKEFGIKSRIEGDNVAFTFQGVKTSVKNNAAEIEKYLTGLGENQFAGAMALRMETLDGSLANLEDSWNAMFRNISASGIGDAIKTEVDIANAALSEFNTMLKSGEVDAYLDASAVAWSGWAKDLNDTIDILGQAIDAAFDYWGVLAKNSGIKMHLGFSEFPAEVRAYFQEAGIEVGSFVEEVQAKAKYISDAFKNIVSDPMGTAALDDLNQEMDRIAASREDRIAGIHAERDATIDAVNQEIDRGKALREEYDLQLAARLKAGQDRLAQYKVGGDGGSGAGGSTGLTPAQQKQADAKAKQLKKEYDDLVASLDSEEEAITRTYNKRKAIIEANTTAESDARDKLMDKLDEWQKKELANTTAVTKAYQERLALLGKVQEIEESTWNDSQKAAAAYQTQIETLWQALQKGVIGQEEYDRSVAKVSKSYEELQDKASGAFFDMEEFSKEASRNVQSAFADFLFDPFAQGLDGMAINFAKVVQRMAAEAAAAKLASALFGGSSGGGSGLLGGLFSAAGSALGGLFGGGASTAASQSMTAGASASGYDGLANWSLAGRASGGSTEKGGVYEVGEFGKPEILREGGKNYLIAGNDGTVTPGVGGEGGGQSVVITQHFNIDGKGNATGQANGDSSSGAVKDLADQMRTVATEEISRQSRPGGLLWKMQQGVR